MNFGSKMLQVVSVLMIVFGAIATVIDLVDVYVYIASGLSPFLIFSFILLISGIGELVVGVVGFINCRDVSKAQALLVCGVVTEALTLLGSILSMVWGGQFNGFTMLGGLLFPIPFTVGAVRIKKEKLDLL